MADNSKISDIEFQKLSLQERAEVLFEQGTFIALRQYYNQRLVLYTLFNFFVEIWYSPVENRIEKIEILKDDKIINLYISSMNKKEDKTD